MRWLARFVLRHSGLIVLVASLSAAAGTFYTVQLYRNLRPDLEELLPTRTRSVRDLDEVTRRLPGLDNLILLAMTRHPEAGKRFVDDLARRLESRRSPLISRLEYRIDREIRFFRDRRALYIDLPDLVELRSFIHDRIAYERDIRNPLNIFSGETIPEPKFDFRSLRMKYDARTIAYQRFPEGYYATPDGTKRAVLIYMSGKFSGIPRIRQLKREVENAVRELDPASYAPDLEIRYSGDLQNILEEHAALIGDLELSAAIVAALVALAMLAFYRAPRATFALVASLLAGALWTFGLSYFAVGYLNANSAFLGSIVMGNGINFGIIVLARYLEERRRGGAHAAATQTALARTSRATLTAALAAALSYGSLMLTEFRGFRQFGLIGLMGMVLCWASAYTVLPALLTLLERRRTLAAPRLPPRSVSPAAGAAWLVGRFPAAVAALSVALTLFSAAALLMRASPSLLEADMTKVRSKQSLEHGSGYYSRYVNQIFRRDLTPVAILAPTRQAARDIAARLRAEKRRLGPRSLIDQVQTLDDFLPRDQKRKIAVLREIREMLRPPVLRRLDRRERALVRDLLSPAALRAVRVRDLPPLVRKSFTEKDGSVGKLVLVEPPISDETQRREPLIGWVRLLRRSADAISPGAPVAGALPVSADILSSIEEDGPRATAFAFLAVVALVVALFRWPRPVAAILASLLAGVCWLGGIVAAGSIKINFLNFVAFPITFGIGVDYGVNVYQRYRQEGPGSILEVIRHTGGAVILCSLTTVIGYGSLLLAQNQALVSFGLVAVLGEIACIAAAVLSLPAFLHLRDRRRARGRKGPPQAEIEPELRRAG